VKRTVKIRDAVIKGKVQYMYFIKPIVSFTYIKRKYMREIKNLCGMYCESSLTSKIKIVAGTFDSKRWKSMH